MIIGLTGGIGSGKSAAASVFKDLGIDSIDADDLARDSLNINSKGYKLLINEFGEKYLDENKNKTKEFESLSKYSNDLNFKLLKSEKDYIMSNKELLSNRNRWHKNLTKDIYISEGVNILKQLSLINSNSETIVSNK